MESLEDKAELVAAQAGQRILVEPRVVDAIEYKPAAVRAVESGDEVKQRGLADAGFADDGHILACLQVQRDVPKYAAAAELAGKTFYFKQARNPELVTPASQPSVGGTRAR